MSTRASRPLLTNVNQKHTTCTCSTLLNGNTVFIAWAIVAGRGAQLFRCIAELEKPEAQ